MHLLEKINIVEGFPAVDLSTAANNGDWVSLKHYKRCAVVFISGIGTAGQDPAVVFLQASDVSGTGSKALNPLAASAYKKQAATSLASTGAWSSAAADLTSNTLTNTDAAEQSLIWVVDIAADELDVDNGFDCLRATVADVGGNAQPGYLCYLLHEPRYLAAPTGMLSAIVD